MVKTSIMNLTNDTLQFTCSSLLLALFAVDLVNLLVLLLHNEGVAVVFYKYYL